MLKNNQIDRISCGFYDNTPFDEDLLDILNRLSANPRIRGQKLKELAWEYIKLTMPEEVNRTKSKSTKTVSKTKAKNEPELTLSNEEKDKADNGVKRIVLR